MKHTLLFAITLLLFFPSVANAQYNPAGPNNNYRTAENPYYWKNRLPHPGYWQQDVYYNIKANLDEQTWIIDGEEDLTYWNNSPDTLTFVYFHLYQNAYQPGSYLDNLQLNNGVKAKYGKYEAQRLGTEVDYIKANGQKLKTEKDNTILKVYLDKPLLPNTSCQLNIKFATFYGNGSVRRRMKFFNSFGSKQFNGAQWYPAIAVYDRIKGWDTDQHLGREFYYDFGTFDVALTFAANYVVEATGVLQNENEVLPKELREKLDIKNFKDKKWNEKPSVITPYDPAVRKTWKYHAENVHNFAFTANPNYRIGEADWNGIRCIALVQEPHAAKWQEVAEFTKKVIQTYSRDFGMYAYPKMVVSDAEDGMEYPMLTMCGGEYPSNKSLVAHEVGHNWFYGMIGNNETYQAPLDEGFTQFLTAWSLEAIDGKYGDSTIDQTKSKYIKRFKVKSTVRNGNVFDGYEYDAAYNSDEPLNTHSDMFNGALGHGGGYRDVYFKTATMLYNLQYVLGDTLFQNAMKHYFSQWEMCHPYIQDFRTSIMDYTHQDLAWFFDEWLNTTKHIDYKVGKIKNKGKADGKYTYEITLKRKDRMQMPIDLAVVTKKDTQRYYIPNTWFAKDIKDSILPRWIGWDKLEPTYKATISTSGKIKNVLIDPTHRLADINMLNNSKKPPIRVFFDSKVYNRPSWEYYALYMRPDLWWNAYDGIKLGFHMNGNYMGGKHKLHLTVWWNTNLGKATDKYNIPDAVKTKNGPVNYNLFYETSLNKWIHNSSVFYGSYYLDGLEGYTLGFKKRISDKVSFTVSAKSMIRPSAKDLNYVIGYDPADAVDSTLWQAGKHNNSINIEFDQSYNYQKGNGTVQYYLRSSALLSGYSYHYLQITAINHTALWRFDLHTRAIGRYGTGDDVAGESALYLAGANFEDMFDNPLTRAKGFVPPTWGGFSDNQTNHFQQGGGLNLRGYAGYTVVEEKDGKTYRAFKGNSGAAINAELDFNRIVKIQPKRVRDYLKFNTYLFADGGVIVYKTDSGQAFSQPRMDAGVGIAMTIKKFGVFQTLKPFTIRFDVPFYISNAPANESSNVKFRWVIGINRSF